MIEVLALPNEIRKLIPDKSWNFQLYTLPKEETLRSINFDDVK